MNNNQRAVWACLVVLLSALMGPSAASLAADAKAFRAGAAVVDITPKELPALVSGGFLERTADRVADPLHARALVFDDGTTKAAIAIVDTLMMARDLIDEAKQRAAQSTGIPSENMLVAATHTHSAPSVMGALGTGVDAPYVRRLPGWIVESIEQAAKNLAPAKVGWTVVVDSDHTNCRRWIKRPDRIADDPFGDRTVRAMMHPGYQNPDYVGPAGPEDPNLTLLAVQSTDGRPVALLANYSMHYFGAQPVSSDYFGRVCDHLTKRIGGDQSNPRFVALLSQGTAGDLHWMDYSQPAKSINIDTYAKEVADVALAAYQTIRYHEAVPLAVAERKLTLNRRLPDERRLAWAQQTLEKMKDRNRPTSIPEVYALEQFMLKKEPTRELKLQAVRIGELGITAIPAEVFGITGLKIKARSPLEPTLNMELANGADGYIPPPEQHVLGGYTTWPARSAGLEAQAEPKIVEAVLQLLEQVSGKPRRPWESPGGTWESAVRKTRPAAYWRLDELVGPAAVDGSGHNQYGTYEDGVAFGLDGAPGAAFASPGRVNRAAHFAGGRMKATVPTLGAAYAVGFWFWNGLPADARSVIAYLFSRGLDAAPDAAGDHLGIGGKAGASGKLIFFNGNARKELLAGKTAIAVRTWNHVLLVRDGSHVRVYLNFQPTPEIDGEVVPGCPTDVKQVFFGGRNDRFAILEGKMDEATVYDRVLTADELASLQAASIAHR